MSLKEIIEKRIEKSNDKVNKCYREKTILTTVVLLSSLIFDSIVFFYTLVVNLNLPLIIILALILLCQLILFLLIIPYFNLSNRSLNFIFYAVAYGLPIIIYLIFAISNFQIFEGFTLFVRIVLYLILVININIRVVNRVFLALTIILAISVNLFLLSNETLTGKQDFARRISYRYNKDKEGYQVSSVSAGLSNKINISNTYMGKKVISIADNAFKNINQGSAISEINIPANIEVISDNAFTVCENPIKINSESTNLSFGNSLSKCNTIESVTFVNGVADNYDFSFLSTNLELQVVLPAKQLSQFKDDEHLKNRLVPYTNESQIYVNYYDGEVLLASKIIDKVDNKYYVLEPNNLELVGESTDFFFGWYPNQEYRNEEAYSFPLELTESTKIYGKFLNCYHISYNIKNDEDLEVENYHRERGIIELLSPEKTGYEFDGWYNDNTYSGDKITELDASKAENIALFGKYDPIVYSIDYQGVKEGVTNNNAKEYTIEDDITIQNLSKSGYTFNGWFDAPEGEEGNKVVEISNEHGDKVLYARWTAITYDLTYILNNGEDDVEDIYDTENGDLMESPTREGYTFDGWYDSEEGGNKITTLVGDSGRKTLHAHWTPITYYITYNYGVAEIDNEEAIEAQLKRYYTLEDTSSISLIGINPAKIGHTFLGWYDAPTGGNKVTTINTKITNNQQVYGRWNIISYDIIFELHDDESEYSIATAGGNATTYKITDGNLLDGVKPGYKFEGWYLGYDDSKENYDDKYSEPITTLAGKTGSQTLHAKWSLETYTITYQNVDLDEHDYKVEYTIEEEMEIVGGEGENSYYLIPEPTRTGYSFEGWYLVVSGQVTSTRVTKIEAHTDYGHKILRAVWTKDVYTINYHDAYCDTLADGEIGPTYCSVIKNDLPKNYSIDTETINLKSDLFNLTRPYYQFKGWFDSEAGGVEVESITKGSMGTKNLYARWEADEYEVTYIIQDSTTANYENLSILKDTLDGKYKYYYDNDNIDFGVDSQFIKDIREYINDYNITILVRIDQQLPITNITSTEGNHSNLTIRIILI